MDFYSFDKFLSSLTVHIPSLPLFDYVHRDCTQLLITCPHSIPSDFFLLSPQWGGGAGVRAARLTHGFSYHTHIQGKRTQSQTFFFFFLFSLKKVSDLIQSQLRQPGLQSRSHTRHSFMSDRIYMHLFDWCTCGSKILLLSTYSVLLHFKASTRPLLHNKILPI